MSQRSRLGDALAGILDRAHRLHPEDLPSLVEDAVGIIGGRETEIYLVDLAQDVLLRFSGAGEAELDIDATIAGRAFRSTSPVTIESEGELRAWVPILDGAERLGVIGAVVDDDEQIESLGRIATLVAEIIVARANYGDALTMGRRRQPLSLPSELRWAMLPPLTFATERVTIAAFVAPPYEIAGDTFDYSVTGPTAHFAVFDAMGHGLEASQMANLAVGAYRHARRSGIDLVDTHHHIDAAIAEEFGSSKFVTAAFAQLDLDRGGLRVLLAGHPRPLLVRDGNLVGDLDVRPTLPLGLGLGDERPSVGEFQLEPADFLLLYSDGVVEGRDEHGEPFGVDRLADFLIRAQANDEPAAETMRRLGRAILAHQGTELEDDATLLSVQWRRSSI